MKWIAVWMAMALATWVMGCVGGEMELCQGVDCSFHGQCVELEGKATCECNQGYVARGYTCIEDWCYAHACARGVCIAEEADGHCACEAGWAGEYCDVCGQGFHSEGTDCVADDEDPCAALSCQHGSCRVEGTAAVCDCEDCYAGERCELCAESCQDFDQDGSCSPACADDSCSGTELCDDSSGTLQCLDPVCVPNPCVHGLCEEQDGAPVCVCEAAYSGETCADCAEQYQDKDGDGNCLPACNDQTCADGVDCDDSSGQAQCLGTGCEGFACPQAAACVEFGGLPACVRSCATRLSYPRTNDPDGAAIEAIYVRGDFNDWTLSHPLSRQADGTWAIDLDLAADHYAYKFFVPTNAGTPDAKDGKWFENPDDRKYLYSGWPLPERNSRLDVEDCTQPMLWQLDQPMVSQNGASWNINFEVQLLRGQDGAAISAADIELSRNHQILDAGAWLDTQREVLVIRDQIEQAGKVTYRIRVSDQAGGRSEWLYLPLWAEERQFSWPDAVLYFAMTDRFHNGDQSNDATVADVDFIANWQGGDIAGVRAKLEAGYFEALGVNAIWLSSITMNVQGGENGKDGRRYTGYHSYWPLSTGWSEEQTWPSVKPIDPHFGDLAEFKALVAEAHRRGIRVLLDLVVNHVHQNSPLWDEHRYDETPWFNGADKPYVCGWDKPIECWFDPFLPDFDFRNFETDQMVLDHAIWLVQETGIDGFRVDALKHMIDEFIYELRLRIEREIATTDQQFYMVGETFDGADKIKYYVNPDMLDGQFDFPLFYKVVSIFLYDNKGGFGDLAGFMESNQGYYGDSAIMSNFMGNHDVCRALSHAANQLHDTGDLSCGGGTNKDQAWNNPPPRPTEALPYQKLRLAWSFLMTIPGIPLIYYGDEIGLEGAGDPGCRKMMLFDDELNSQQSTTLQHVQKLTAARHAHRAFRYGRVESLYQDGPGNVWAYGLAAGSDRAVVVLNRDGGSQSAHVDVSKLGLSNGQVLSDVLSDATVTVSAGAIDVNLDARAAAVLVIE